MSTEAEEKYKNFDFSSDLSWQEYFKGLFPTPAMDKLDKIKRKWFKRNIDSNLEVETHVAADTSEDTSATNTSQQNTSSTDNTSQNANASSSSNNTSSASNSASSGSAPMPGGFLGKVAGIVGRPLSKIIDIVYKSALPMKDKFYTIEGVLKFVFIICALLVQSFANMIAFNVCLLGFFRQTGKPRWDINYGKKALENEFLQNILYMVPFAFFPNSKNLVYFLPLGIHFWIGFCEFVNLKLPTVYPKIAKFADFTRQNRGTLMYQKAKLEIMLFAFIIILLFFGGSNLILVIFYGNFLKSKYLLNNYTKSAFYEINQWVEGKINAPYCPGIVRMLVGKIRSFCAYMVKV